MPTIEDIEYDSEKLGIMTQKELTLQQIYRSDRHFPKQETQVNARKFAAETITKLKVLLAGLPDEVPTIKQAFAAAIAEYEEGI